MTDFQSSVAQHIDEDVSVAAKIDASGLSEGEKGLLIGLVDSSPTRMDAINRRAASAITDEWLRAMLPSHPRPGPISFF